jgi:diacylglycerol kinase (ATP)
LCGPVLGTVKHRYLERVFVSHVVLIANPAAGRGRGARVLARIRDTFVAHGVNDVRATTRAGEEARLVRLALDAGATTLAILGGDGTWSRCAAAVAEAGALEAVRLAFLSAGTGNDFAKMLDAPAHDPVAMARLASDGGPETRVDLGRVEHDSGGHWFLNVAGFGFDVAVLAATAQGGRLSGSTVYVAGALRHLLRYDGFDVEVRSALAGSSVAAPRPGRSPSAAGPRRCLMLTVSNGLHLGGVFRIAPTARVDDGLLDLVEVGDVRGVARLPLFVRALRGTHLAHPLVRAGRATEFSLRFAVPPRYEVDGELEQAGSAEVEVRAVPRALRVLGAARSAGPNPVTA